MRIAFLISVENGLLYDAVWRRWLEYTPNHEYLVLVHARRPDNLTDGSFAAEHLIDVNITALQTEGELADPAKFAAARDNYDVHRLLLNKALQDDEEDNPVTHFVFCDSDSIPIKSFAQARTYLASSTNGGEYSLVQFCPHQIKTEAGRKVLHMALVKYIHALRQHPEFARDIPITHWYWHSKFTIFCRNHAQTLCADAKMCALLPKYKIANVCTHYPMLVLSREHGDEIVNVPTTFEAWGQDGQVRVYHELTEEMKPALRFENLLFATGMSPASGIADIVETELWDQPHQVDPKTGETAQYTGL